jgi:hypothetical protein
LSETGPINEEQVVTDLAAGIAGEHLVCADLLLSGYRAYLTDQNCPYDVAVDHANRLIRIQVRSTRQQRGIPQRSDYIPAYLWYVRKAGKLGRRQFRSDEVDVVALVALDTREIAYISFKGIRQTVQIRPTNAPGYERGGVCSACGIDRDERTHRCATCRSRHWRRSAKGGSMGKRFADFPFSSAIA